MLSVCSVTTVGMESKSHLALQINPHLTFDTMEINTENAEKYLKINAPFLCFGPLIKVKPTKSLKDSYGNEILSMDLSKEYDNFKKTVAKFGKSEVLSKKITSLAKEIENNLELVSQIEYLVRKTPLETSKKQLQVVVQHFFNVAMDQFVAISAQNCLKLHNKPLLYLGLIANSLAAFDEIIIETTVDSAVVSHFIAQLCTKAGFTVNLVVTDNFKADGPVVNDFEDNQGCIGIVTEKSDIDSAIDMFIGSSICAPWSLQRIFVQESIYEQFGEAMRSKSIIKRVDGNEKTAFQSTAKDMFAFDDKVFLLDYSATNQVHIRENKKIILIEGYRTSNEVLSLVKLYKHMYISLWSSDISEAHEIAYGVEAPVVWINDLAIVDGPIRAAEAIYSTFQLQYLNAHVDIDHKISLSLENVLKKFSKSLERVNLSDDSNLFKQLVDNNFVEVANGKMCVGICQPTAVVWRHQPKNISNAVNTVSKSDISAFVSMVKSVELEFPFELDWEQFNLTVYNKTKAVWSNYGTIFAN